MVIGIPQKNWATELTNSDLLVDVAWNKIITTNVILFYARDKSIPLKSDRASNSDKASNLALHNDKSDIKPVV